MKSSSSPLCLIFFTLLPLFAFLAACTTAPTPTFPIVPPNSPSPLPLFTSSPSPTPAPFLTPTFTLEPIPTETQPPLLLSPLFTAQSIFEVSWSPDNQILAYWSFIGEQDVNPCDGCGHPPGVLSLHFYNIQTQLTCDYPIPGYYGYSPDPVFAWAEDGQILVRGDDEITRISTPCQDDFAVVSKTESERLLNLEAFSPDGTYYAQIESQNDSVAGGANFTLTLKEVATGQVMNVVNWHDDATRYPGALGINGIWITDDLFLVAKSENPGPLLIPVGEEVILIAQDLFGLPTPCLGDSCETPVEVEMVMDEATNTYHILLFGIYYGQTTLPNVQLYHSESGEVEELAFPAPWLPRFSPDGQWIFLREHAEALMFSARRLDKPTDEPFQFPQYEQMSWGLNAWSPSGTKVIVGDQPTLLKFPTGEQIGTWLIKPYQANQFVWSHDERYIVVVGVINSTTAVPSSGLFIIPIHQSR